MADDEKTNGFEQWCVVELMGHVKMAGRVSEVELFGSKLARIDIPIDTPDNPGGFATQYFGASSVYRMSPVSEELARAVAAKNKPQPVYVWDLPKALAAAAPGPMPMYESDDDSRDDDFD